MDNRTIWSDALVPGIKKYAVDEFNKHPLEIGRLFNIFNSERSYEEFKDAFTFGKLTETAEGHPSVLDTLQDGYKTTLTAKQYSKENIVTYLAKADDLYGVFEQRARGLGSSAVDTINDQAFSVFRNAFSTSYTSYGDGKPLTLSGFKTDSYYGKAQGWVTLTKQAFAVQVQRLSELATTCRCDSPFSMYNLK